jgi:hypothetical protein
MPQASLKLTSSGSPFLSESDARQFWIDLHPSTFPAKLRLNPNESLCELRRLAHIVTLSTSSRCPQPSIYVESFNERYSTSSKRLFLSMSTLKSYPGRTDSPSPLPTCSTTIPKPTGNHVMDFLRPRWNEIAPLSFEKCFPSTTFPKVTLVHAQPRIDKTIFNALLVSLIRKVKHLPAVKALHLEKLPSVVTLALSRRVNDVILTELNKKIAAAASRNKPSQAQAVKKPSPPPPSKSAKTKKSSPSHQDAPKPSQATGSALTKSAKRRARKARANAKTLTGLEEPAPSPRKAITGNDDSTSLPVKTELIRQTLHHSVKCTNMINSTIRVSELHPLLTQDAIIAFFGLKDHDKISYQVPRSHQSDCYLCYDCLTVTPEPCLLSIETQAVFTTPAPSSTMQQPTLKDRYPVRIASVMLKNFTLLFASLRFSNGQLVSSETEINALKRFIYDDLESPDSWTIIPETGYGPLLASLFATSSSTSRVHQYTADPEFLRHKSTQNAPSDLDEFVRVQRSLTVVIDALKYGIRF